MTNAKHSSKSNDHGTPEDIVESSRTVMGEITLDPATSDVFNERVVKAKYWYTQEDNGLTKMWTLPFYDKGNEARSKVFLNPPGGTIEGYECRSQAIVWWNKLLSEYDSNNVEEAIFIGFTIEQLGNKHSYRMFDFPMCICNGSRSSDSVTSTGRIKFLSEDESGELKEQSAPTHSCFIVYLPPKDDPVIKQQKIQQFRLEFAKFGVARQFV